MKYIYIFFIRTFLCVILFLILGILCKYNVEWKQVINEEIYNKNISFSMFQKFYNKYLGGIFPIETMINNNVIPVFNEELNYNEVVSYGDGVSLSVDINYLVPVLNDGIVVYIGDKENYGRVVIIEDLDGINVWYGNLCNVNVSLYDTVKKGSYLGNVCEQTLYLIFSKKNSFLEFDDYLG